MFIGIVPVSARMPATGTRLSSSLKGILMLKREMAANALHASGLGRLLRKVMPWNGLLVLNYHRVGDNTGSRFNQDLWSATEEDFDAQIRFFKTNFDVIGQADLTKALGRRRGRHVQITFDDGYRDNYEVAYPILKSNGVSATFFISTGLLDHPRVPWWDEIAWIVRGSAAPFGGKAPKDRLVQTLCSLYRSLPADKTDAFLDFLGASAGTGRCDAAEAKDLWMTWDMVREMRDGGMAFGGHTVSHCELSRLPKAEQARELRECKQRFEEELREPMTTFSYPYGEAHAFNADTFACLRELNVKFAYSYYGGYQDFRNWEPFNINRFAMERHVSPALWTLLGTAPRWWRLLD